MFCNRCSEKYHGNSRFCPKCGKENVVQVAERAEQKADAAIKLAGDAKRQAEDAVELARQALDEAHNHRKQIGIAAGTVTAAITGGVSIYNLAQHPYLLWA